MQWKSAISGSGSKGQFLAVQGGGAINLSLPVSSTEISKGGTPDGVPPLLSVGWHL